MKHGRRSRNGPCRQVRSSHHDVSAVKFGRIVGEVPGHTVFAADGDSPMPFASDADSTSYRQGLCRRCRPRKGLRSVDRDATTLRNSRKRSRRECRGHRKNCIVSAGEGPPTIMLEASRQRLREPAAEAFASQRRGRSGQGAMMLRRLRKAFRWTPEAVPKRLASPFAGFSRPGGTRVT